MEMTAQPQGLLGRLKYTAAEIVKTNPYSWWLFWNVIPRMSFLLPHDRSYFGFRHLAKKKSGLFLDVGANNGISAAGFRRINKTYRILSIEPNRHHERSLKRLKRRIRDFDYRLVGAGNHRSETTIYTPIYRGIGLHCHTSCSENYVDVSVHRDYSARIAKRIVYDEQIIEIIPLDDLDLSPSIVKIDVEGFDAEVLLGLSKTIERCRPFIMVEYTPHFMDECAALLSEHRYLMFVYDHTRDTFRQFAEERESDAWNASGLQVNLFCVPEEHAATIPRNERV